MNIEKAYNPPCSCMSCWKELHVRIYHLPFQHFSFLVDYTPCTLTMRQWLNMHSTLCRQTKLCVQDWTRALVTKCTKTKGQVQYHLNSGSFCSWGTSQSVPYEQGKSHGSTCPSFRRNSEKDTISHVPMRQVHVYTYVCVFVFSRSTLILYYVYNIKAPNSHASSCQRVHMHRNTVVFHPWGHPVYQH